jgi:mannose-6-phosphate isomerase
MGAFVMFYPLFFEPVYKKIIWGGRNFEIKFNRNLPDGKIAESWEICCHKNGMSTVLNGAFKNKTIKELFDEYRTEIFGLKCSNLDRFPLLIKFLDANDKLSVQVHPDDNYALKHEGDLGKTEMWYIVHAKEGAQIIYGTNPKVTKEDFKKAIEIGDLEKHLNFMPVKSGDYVFIPSGTVHAILDGILIAEIQQNSDTTYRVYDWNRKDANGKSRELHIDKALDVINFEFKAERKEAATLKYDGYEVCTIATCDFFTVDKICVSTKYKDRTSKDTFFVYTCVEGSGKLHHNNIRYDIPSGCSFLIPSSMGEFEIEGNLTLLKSYI